MSTEADRIEALVGGENDEVDTEALLKCIEALPLCAKCDFVPATHVGALMFNGQPVTGLKLCDKHDLLIEQEFDYVESLRRAVKLLVDFGDPPWWLEWAGVTFKEPKVAVEVDEEKEK